MVSFGVDVSKDWVDCARTDNGRKCKQQDRVPNTPEQLQGYFRQQQLKCLRLVVTVESTGMYHLALVRVCLELGIPVRVINPIVTKQLTRASIRGVKTDQKDAFRIALIGLTKEGYLMSDGQLSPSRFYLRAGRRLAAASRSLQASKQHYALAQVPAHILDDTFDPACQVLLQASARLQLEGSRVSDGRLLRLLQSLPGFGPTTAALVLGEVGSIERFTHAKQLIAYAGLDPRIRRSGTSIRRTGRLTKRGSPHLRHALFIAASVARRYDPQLRAVYERKRAQGKSYRQAVIHVARLLTYRLYAVWKRGTPYQKEAEGLGGKST